jgi:hypothetical protein
MFRPLTILSLTAALLLSFASSSVAQTGACPTTPMTVKVNPSGWLCITPAADYLSSTPDPPVPGVPSTPVVSRLEVLLFNSSVTDTATGSPTQVINIGKPSVNAQGAIWVQRSEITSLPLNQLFKARVWAIGSGATPVVSPRSPESDPFIRLGPAPVPLAPTAIRLPE